MQRSRIVKYGGVFRSENAGMSSENHLRMVIAENPRFPPQCKSAEGQSVLRAFLIKGGVA